MNREQRLEEAWRWWTNRFVGSELSNAMVDYSDYRVGQETAKLQAELTALREFVRGLRHIESEDWHGHYGKYEPKNFRILGGEGELIATGKDCLEAVTNYLHKAAGTESATDEG